MIVEPDFADHWKVDLLVRRMKSEGAVRCLLRLWAHCQARKDDVFPFTPEMLAAVCRWPGKPERLWDAMTDAHGGFLVRATDVKTEGQWRVRGWREVNCGLFVNKVQNPNGKNQYGDPKKQDGKRSAGGRPTSKAEVSGGQPTLKSEVKGGRREDEGLEGIEGEERGREAAVPPVSLSGWAELIRESYCRGDAPMVCQETILAEFEVHGTAPAEMLEKVRACSAAIVQHAPGGAANAFVPSAQRFFTERLWADPDIYAQRWLDGLRKKEKGGGFMKPERPGVAVRVLTHPRLPEPPCDWRAVLAGLYPAEEYPQLEHAAVVWGMLEPDTRREVVCECRSRGLLPDGWEQPGVPDGGSV